MPLNPLTWRLPQLGGKQEEDKKANTRPSHHANSSGTLFRNPWPSAKPLAWNEILAKGVPLAKAQPEVAKHAKARRIKTEQPDFTLPTDPRKIKAVWFGHATCYVELPAAAEGSNAGLRLLFDPIFSSVAGPTQYTGPKRSLQAPCPVTDLPGVDAVFLSHSHFDHCDYQSIMDTHKRFPAAIFYVPLGIAAWLRECKIPDDSIREFDWHEDHWQDAATQSSDYSDSSALVRITCVPAQHNSGRRHDDQNTTLWCGWVVEQYKGRNSSQESSSSALANRQTAIYFAGDTGYRRYAQSEEVCPAFKEIGETFGPLDLSFVPIWRGGTLGFVSSIGLRIDHDSMFTAYHGSPGDGVAIHKDVQSKHTIPIHFGTFVGSEMETFEALVELHIACENAGDVDDDADAPQKPGRTRMGAIDIGQIVEI